MEKGTEAIGAGRMSSSSECSDENKIKQKAYHIQPAASKNMLV